MGEPVEDISNEFEIWLTEVLHGDDSWITKSSHNLTEVSQLSERHEFKSIKELKFENL